MKIARQGDVAIIFDFKDKVELEVMPESELVLARGEATGHAHRIVEGRAQLFRLKQPFQREGAIFVFLLRCETEVRLFHETHPDQVYPIGDHLIGRQQEWDWLSEVRRNVAD